MSKRFAEGTSVTVEKSLAELSTLLQKHGATQVQTGRDFAQGRAVVTFRIEGRCVQIDLKADRSKLPDPKATGSFREKTYPQGWFSTWSVQKRTEWVAMKLDQSERENWRRLVLVVKAKLELIAVGGTTFEREFLADILLPDGKTVLQEIRPSIEAMYLSGHSVPLLPGK